MNNPTVISKIALYLDDPSPLLFTWTFSRRVIVSFQFRIDWILSKLPDWFLHLNTFNSLLTPEITDVLVTKSPEKLPFIQVCKFLIQKNHFNSLQSFLALRSHFHPLQLVIKESLWSYDLEVIQFLTKMLPPNDVIQISYVMTNCFPILYQNNPDFARAVFPYILNWSQTFSRQDQHIPSLFINSIIENRYPTYYLDYVKSYSSGIMEVIETIEWNKYTEPEFLSLLTWAVKSQTLSTNSEFLGFDLLEMIVSKDYRSCLNFLMLSGLEIYDDSYLLLAVKNNASHCLDELLNAGIFNPSCIYEAAKMGNVQLLSKLLQHCDNTIAQNTLKTAILHSQYEVVKYLVHSSESKVVCDRDILRLASQPSGDQSITHKKRWLILQLLLNSSKESDELSKMTRDKLQTFHNIHVAPLTGNNIIPNIAK
ncbi:hypothetical protein BC833DRAFT_609669 [Globomyces pollinis-pini]|nr:hypothetical protein BC833DRAFT_609669 [Globomyces pollinis-pini]